MEEVAGEALRQRLYARLDRHVVPGDRDGGTGSLGFIFGLLMVFLILAAQYERWTLPLAVLSRCRSPCSARVAAI